MFFCIRTDVAQTYGVPLTNWIVLEASGTVTGPTVAVVGNAPTSAVAVSDPADSFSID